MISISYLNDFQANAKRNSIPLQPAFDKKKL
ncbi:hypothetical protein SAMN05421827_106203 [Pedobacter terrae]|uniref:Uncharacterized protein n=1 Tax=Pedobacter terrae TaxID=405671 RepID=A0A1G7U790_9SPHI|nr:hypothetical protein SAMN05421827_106203 [Pedobacter terrae]